MICGFGRGFHAARKGALMTGAGNEAPCVTYDIGLSRDQSCRMLVFGAHESFDWEEACPLSRTTVLVRGTPYVAVGLRGFFTLVAASLPRSWSVQPW